MCGIYFSCSEEGYVLPSGGVLNCLKRRGPDHSQVVRQTIERPKHADSAWDRTSYLTTVSTVLSLRGEHVVRQPLEDVSSGSLLCWNGEAWKISGTILDGSDVQMIFGLLLKATEGQTVKNNYSRIAHTESLQAVFNVFASISGPYSFVFYDGNCQRVFYGRDVLGRRSLLASTSENGSIIISSICNGSVSENWIEVEANGMYMLDLKAGRACNADGKHALKLIRWSEDDEVPGKVPFLVRSLTPVLDRHVD